MTTACLACGYDARGSPAERVRCAECGAHLPDSVGWPHGAVELDAAGVRYRHPLRTPREVIPWPDVDEAALVASYPGSFVEDLALELAARGQTFRLSVDAPGAALLLKTLATRRGSDAHAAARAMASNADGRFVCWRATI